MGILCCTLSHLVSFVTHFVTVLMLMTSAQLGIHYMYRSCFRSFHFSPTPDRFSRPIC